MEGNQERIVGGMLSIPYISPTPGKISIIAKSGFSHKIAVTDDEFKLLKECGFNVMTCSMTYTGISNTLEAAGVAGVKVLLNNHMLLEGQSNNNSLVTDFRNYPALGGWDMLDEPSYSELTARGCITVSIEEESCSLYDSVQQILAKDRTHLVYINLAAGGDCLEGHTLEEYLDAYEAGFDTGLTSYDVYPVSEIRRLLLENPSSIPPGREGEVSVNYAFFYRCLKMVSERARERGGAFWAYVRSMSYVNGDLYRPLALEKYMRFEAFSALAYGAQGVAYWRYKRGVNKEELYLSAPISLSEKRTAVWYYAQRVNREIEKYSGVFTGVTSVRVYHAGTDQHYGADPWRGEVWPLGDILVYGGNGAVVSFLSNAGGSFIAVVSRDVLNYQRVKMYFYPDSLIEELTPLTSTGAAPSGDVSVSPEKVERTLIPGGYLIYRVKGRTGATAAQEPSMASMDSDSGYTAPVYGAGIRAVGRSRIFDNPVNMAYSNPTPGSISIIASTPNDGESAPSDELCKEMAECGFNSALMTVTLSEVTQALANCGAHGIRPLLHHSHLTRSEAACADFVDRFKGNPNLGGWDLWGQPAFSELSDGGDLQKYYNLIRKKDGDAHAIFVSLAGGPVPRYMEGADGSIHTYKEYIDRFQSSLHPSFWPYVLYPVYKRNNALSIQYDAFFRDLEIYSLMASYTERPFWAYVRSQAFKSTEAEAPAPTEAHMRFAAFSALAYGAQGLVYWTYRQRASTSAESYSDAPVDVNGSKTPVWNYVKRINEEIRLLNEVFYESEPVECRHTGKTLYDYTARLTHPIGPLASISAGDSGVLVSHLCTHGRDYLVIVSHDLVNSQTVSLDFSPYWTVGELVVKRSATTVLARFTVNTGVTVKKMLLPGGYLIFDWI